MSTLTSGDLGLLADMLETMKGLPEGGMTECEDDSCGYYAALSDHFHAIDVLAPKVREAYLSALRDEA